MSKQDNSNAQVRPEELTIVGGPLADYEMYAKIPEPIEVSVSTPWGPMQYNMFYHNGDLILEFQGAVTKEQPTETEPVVAEQPETPAKVEMPRAVPKTKHGGRPKGSKNK
jgi:hypothetical protein